MNLYRASTLLDYEARIDAMDAYSHKAEEKAEETADETCDMFGLEGEERRAYWDKVYYAEYDRLMGEYEKNP